MSRQKPLDYDRAFLAGQDRRGLLRAFRFLRMQDCDPSTPNAAAAQYDRLATVSSIRAEFKRRGWKAPKARPCPRW